ncbi:ABC transporter permease [Microlunatus soli]|uniref:Iron(III) transport system permease protein n=1 Tax=Microlunatus soli TaxID=630515 RepID=A0A1H1PCW4_9ACTN|nr:iron ABC transporter permease [Microlunatus soli]SDS08963.1 iron(III) transport system permease protein [Microlunatus soli]
MINNSSALPAPRYRRLFGRTRGWWIQYATLIVLLILVLAPVVPTVLQSFASRPLYEAKAAFDPSSYYRLFADEDFGTVIINSLLLAILTTVFSLVAGVVLAVLLIRVNIPGGRLMGGMVLWPIYISPLVLAFGWIIIYGPAGYLTRIVGAVTGVEAPWNLYSIPGMALASTVAFTPIAYLYCANALRMADTSLEDAARTVGARPLRVIWSVILPMLRPPIMYAALLIFTASLEELSIPLLYGEPVDIELFGSFLYDYGLDNANPDYGVLGAAAVLFLVMLAVLVVVQGLVLRNSRRFIAVRGKATRIRPFDLGRLRWVGLLIAVGYLLLGPGLPLLGLLARAFTQVLTPLINPFRVLTAANFQIIFGYSEYIGSVGHSLLVALVGGVLTTLLAALAVVVARRSPMRPRRAVEFVSLAPQALPGVMLGLGLFWTILFVPTLRPLQGTLTAITIAFGIAALPAAFSAISPAVLQIGDELDAAARSVGADWWRTVSRVLLRLVLPAMLTSFVLVFVTMIKAFSAAVFLGDADSQVIGTTSLTLWANGNTGSVAALSCLQIAITAAVVAAAEKLFTVRPHA